MNIADRLLKMWVSARTVFIARDERGATAVEYGILVALIAALLIGVAQTLGEEIEAAFNTVIDTLP